MTSFEELEDYTFGTQEEEDLEKYYSGQQESKLKKLLKHKKTIALAIAVVIIIFLIITSIVFASLFFLKNGDSGGSKHNNNNNTDSSPTPLPDSTSPTPLPSQITQSSPFPQPSASPQPGDAFDPVVISYWQDLAAEFRSNMNSSADPCVDFYEYACGGWVAKTVLEEGEVSYYKSFSTIEDYVDEIVQGIIDADWPMIGTFYSNCMDINLRDEISSSPLIPYLDQIDQLINIDSLPTLLGGFQRYGIGGFFDIDVSPDLYNPEFYNFEIDQGGIGMPDRDYYFMEDPYGRSVQEAYKTFIQNALESIQEYVSPNDDETSLPFSDQAENIYQLEVQLARISNTTEERRDILGLYNIYEIYQLPFLTPSFSWIPFFTEIGLDSSTNQINVISPSFFSGFNDLLESTPTSLIRNYLRWRTVLKTSSLLSQSYLDIQYNYIDALYGSDIAPSIDEICLSRTNSMLGMLIGRYFIEEVWDEEFQLRAEELVNSIEISFHEHLPNVDWMDEETTVQAEAKLSMVVDKIGYPNNWPDYSSFIIYPNQWFNNSMEGRKFYFDDMIAAAPLVNDKEAWDMTPQTVNAYYDPQENEMVFPAAILQEPMFSKRYPDAMNFGGIGAVMGHELTHGFDDQGRQFDGTGAYRNWWTQTASDNYDERAECVVDLYDQFEVEDGVYVDGAQTLGENIADMGGVKDAYRALLVNLATNHYNSQIEQIFGMTNEQLFFVSYGQVWCSKILPEYEELLVIVDVHSPSKARVNNPLSQFESFAEAFSCPVDSPMNPSQKCVVW